MPTHDEEKKRFFKNPREEPDKKFSDAFKFFARKVELKEVINDPKVTKSKKNRSKDKYIELIEDDGKFLEKELLKAKRQPKHLGTEDRIKGGKAPKYNFGLQQFVDQLFIEFKRKGRSFTLSSLKRWLEANAPREDGYDPEPVIPDCGDIEFYEDRVWWVDSRGQRMNFALKSIERYVQRANNRAAHKTV